MVQIIRLEDKKWCCLSATLSATLQQPLNRWTKSSGPRGQSRARTYRPGIGPLAEADAIERALRLLKNGPQASDYRDASPKPYPNSRQKCDLVIPNEWAIELKLIRPFGDNGAEAEHWSENVLHPYAGNTSSIGDCFKLAQSNFAERKAVIVFGYEHTPPQIDLETAIRAFELLESLREKGSQPQGGSLLTSARAEPGGSGGAGSGQRTRGGARGAEIKREPRTRSRSPVGCYRTFRISCEVLL
jgi:hypothetical protein